jgi:hypothetical protein
MNYLVVLFKNKERKKIINKFVTKERAQAFYNKLLKESESVVFDTRVENAEDCFFELGLLEKTKTNFDLYFIRDNLGRQVKVELDDPDYKLIQVSNYKLPDKIFDVNENKKITFDTFLKKYLPKTYVKLISRINNKVILQNDDKINLFSFKNETESLRFLSSLSEFMLDNSRMDSIIVSETSKPQKKYLYDLLESKGIKKSSLYRRTTTFRPRK